MTIIAWAVAHLYHKDEPATDPAGNKITKVGIMLALALPALCLTGCTSVYTNGCVTTVQNRFFGFQVTATSSTTGTPSALLGAGSSLVTIYPTSTNPLYCAPFFSTASGNATANPFDVSINETIGAGNVASAIGTNGTASSVVVPKIAKPEIKLGESKL